MSKAKILGFCVIAILLSALLLEFFLLKPSSGDLWVESSKNQPFQEIAPTLLTMLADFQRDNPHRGFNTVNKKPWNEYRSGSDEWKYLMARAVWNHHIHPKNDYSKASLLLTLFRKTSRLEEKSILISSMKYEQWIQDDEKELVDIAGNKNEPLELRQQSIEALIYHNGLNSYLPIALEIVFAHENGWMRCGAYCSINGQANGKSIGPSTLIGANKHADISAGFKILSELPEDKLRDGCCVAVRLGIILKIKNEFAPDSSAAKYQGNGCLNDKFFTDTVSNALDWRAKNWKD